MAGDNFGPMISSGDSFGTVTITSGAETIFDLDGFEDLGSISMFLDTGNSGDPCVINASSSTWNIGGNWQNVAGTLGFNAETSTVIFDGAATQVIFGENVWYNLTIANTAAEPGPDAVVVPLNPQTVTNTLSVIDGAWGAVDGDDYNNFSIGKDGLVRALDDEGVYAEFTVSGDWTNYGYFDHNNSTVVLDGDGTQTIYGATVFYNLTKEVTSEKTLRFDQAYCQIIEGTLTLNGDTDAYLNLRSTTDGKAWVFYANTTDIDWVDVQDSYNSSTLISPTNYTDSGHNYNWFSGPDSVWTGSESSDWNDADNWTGGVPTTGEDALIPEPEEGNYQPTLNVDTDVVEYLSINSGAVLTVGTFTLYAEDIGMWPGSEVTVSTGVINVSDLLSSNGTITSTGASNIFIGGGWNMTDGTFVSTDSTVRLTGSGLSYIITDSQPFNNLVLNNGNGTFQLKDDMTIEGDFQLVSGTFNQGSNDISLEGDMSLALGTSYSSSGTITFSGTTTQFFSDINSTKQNIGNIRLSNSLTLTSDMACSDITIDASTTLDASNGDTDTHDITTDGSWVNNGTYIPGTDEDEGSMVMFTGTDVTINSGGTGSAKDFYDLFIDTTGTVTITGNDLKASNIDVCQGTLDITGYDIYTEYGLAIRNTEAADKTANFKSGADDHIYVGPAGDDAISLFSLVDGYKITANFTEFYGTVHAGSLLIVGDGQLGSFFARMGMGMPQGYVVLNAGNAQFDLADIDTGGYVPIIDGDSLYMESSSSGTNSINAGSSDWALEGNLDIEGGTFTHGTGTITFDGGSIQYITSDGQDMGDIRVSETGTVLIATDAFTGKNIRIDSGATFDLNGQDYTQHETTALDVYGTLKATADENIDAVKTPDFYSGSTMEFSASTGTRDIWYFGADAYLDSTLKFSGAGTYTIASSPTTINCGTLTVLAGTLAIGSNTLNVSGSLSNSSTITISTGILDVGGNFTNSGTITSSGAADIRVGGNWEDSGTLNAGSSTVTFDAAATGKTISAGDSPFYNVVFANAAGGWTISGSFSAGGSFTVSS
ncbi:MAG TPA: hypothetical protein PLV52_03020, partial [Candidatus Omnitrophota bacterium]|nr:hypothetical protein [Candidatus Omnitrophota bacterium]